MFYEVDTASLAPVFLHLKPLLGLLVLGSILFNFKGRKSKIATLIVTIAFIFLILGTYFQVQVIPNWAIYTAFFFGAWYNGNFEYFYRFLKFKTP